MLRSVSTWNSGTRTTEDSIHQAYIHSIKNAKHYIYIENQFFITLSGGSGNEVSNEIGRALFERILAAHRWLLLLFHYHWRSTGGQSFSSGYEISNRTRSCFRVYVVMPLLPGFEGEIGTGSGTAIQAVSHWNYASICRCFMFTNWCWPVWRLTDWLSQRK